MQMRKRTVGGQMVCWKAASDLVGQFSKLGVEGVSDEHGPGRSGPGASLRDADVPVSDGPGILLSAGESDVVLVPNPDHYPTLKYKGGKLTADNVRLAHVACNNFDFAIRDVVGEKLLAGDSLDAISQYLIGRGWLTPWGQGTWTPARVRKAYVS